MLYSESPKVSGPNCSASLMFTGLHFKISMHATLHLINVLSLMCCRYVNQQPLHMLYWTHEPPSGGEGVLFVVCAYHMPVTCPDHTLTQIDLVSFFNWQLPKVLWRVEEKRNILSKHPQAAFAHLSHLPCLKMVQKWSQIITFCCLWAVWTLTQMLFQWMRIWTGNPTLCCLFARWN